MTHGCSLTSFPQVRRGHLRWKDFRYQEALLDFEDAASLEADGGAIFNRWVVGKKIFGGWKTGPRYLGISFRKAVFSDPY